MVKIIKTITGKRMLITIPAAAMSAKTAKIMPAVLRIFAIVWLFMVRLAGIEPAAFSMSMKRSTTELKARVNL